jgi:alkaline phosphatase
MANARIRFRATCLPLVVGLLLLPISGLAAGARNVILMIGDGMGPGHFGAAWLYSNRILGKELRMVEVMKSGRTAYVVNDTADAIVTESAAAATQIACGVKVPARVVGTAGELQRAAGPKVLGLFNLGNMAFEIDRARTAEPSLAAMTAKTLEVLAKNRKGFFAMIEAGRIDHAAHRNDAAATIRDTLAFDGAVGVALDFQRRNPDTLLIVAADHETGGMALIERGKKDVGMDLFAIQKVQTSLERILDALGKNPTPENVREVVKTHTAIEFTEEEARLVANDTLYTLAFVLQSYLGVGWASQGHTASPLFAFGSGPGSEDLVGFRHNTELFRIMKTALEAAAR